MDLTLQQPEHEPQQPSRGQVIWGWLISRYAARHDRDTYVWRIAGGSLVLFSCIAMVLATLGMPTGLPMLLDLTLFLALNLALMFGATWLVAIILSMFHVPIPRRFAAALIYVGVEAYLILHFAEFGVWMALLFASVFALGGAALGCAAGLLFKLKISHSKKWYMALLAAVVASVLLIGITGYSPQEAAESDQAADGAMDNIDTSVFTGTTIPDPSQPGPWQVHELSYGSGNDKHRSVFGDGTDIKTMTVDGSKYINKWSWLKTWFWGFDEHELPINGRVWMPEGDGKHPIALIVHGNHLMEYFSDDGYEYLGKLLASHGVIAVSVDQNFFNYSVWSGIPNDDMKMRAWLMLKHLQELQRLDAELGHPISGKVDFSRIALIGHSRGGQAVAMAADSERWFADDHTLDSLESVRIEAVAAIAPTDKKVDKQSAQLENVSYLTLQGARDADVNNFYGDRQYSRTSFTTLGGDERFKSAVYIADANHSQFNTDWGRMDERLPGGLFLSRQDLLEPEEQRRIAEVYIGAFMQTTLLDNQTFKPLFSDYRSGLQWLPDTEYVSRYEQANFQELARFEQGGKLKLHGGSTAEAEGMENWTVTSAEDRDGNHKGTKGLELEWSEAGAEYSVELSPAVADQAMDMDQPQLVFSMANLERDLIKEIDQEDGEPLDDYSKSADQAPSLPEVEVELNFTDGEQATVELSGLLPTPEPIYTQFTHWPWLDQRIKGKKYKEANEPVFQTYVLPLDPFYEEVSGDRELSRITFRFQNQLGKVMLDDIGLMPK